MLQGSLAQDNSWQQFQDSAPDAYIQGDGDYFLRWIYSDSDGSASRALVDNISISYTFWVYSPHYP